MRSSVGAGFRAPGSKDATDGATGEPLLGRPETSGRLTVGAELPLAVRGRATWIHTGGTPRLEEEGRLVRRAAFSGVDLRLARELPGGVGLALGVDNLFDAVPEAWPGYARRRFHLTVDAARRWTP